MKSPVALICTLFNYPIYNYDNIKQATKRSEMHSVAIYIGESRLEKHSKFHEKNMATNAEVDSVSVAC